ncbi:glycine-rich domain-containing protein, partial [Planctomycetota bacterium]
MSKIEVNQISSQCGSTLTVGQSGDTVTLAAGATQTGFGRTGTVDWDTTAKTTGFTAVSGVGYFVNTTSGAITVTLPATPSAGDIVSIADYTNTFQTNNVTVARNGSPIGGVSADAILSTEGQSVTFIYVDATEGWKNVQDSTSNVIGNAFLVATGGTITECGNFKIHTFTGPGTFSVSQTAVCSSDNVLDYLVVAGGGAGGGPSGSDSAGSGGGGAGGFRISNATCMPAPLTSPLANPTGITATVSSFPITVGAGGSPSTPSGPYGGGNGNNSIFSTIISTGGGGGGANPNAPEPLRSGQPGGSGGGAGRSPAATTGGTGNTPPVSPPQGNNGGIGNYGPTNYGQGGGGGASAAGNVATGASPTVGGSGGAGSFVAGSGFANCNGTPGPVCGARYFAGGGGGSTYQGGTAGPGGVGGGGAGNFSPNNAASPGISGVSGTTNSGGGGGGMSQLGTGGAGGSGIVIIRYKF